MRLLSILLLSSAFLLASEPETNALAVAGASAAAAGKVDTAEGLLYKALVRDPSCGLALYELGKIEQAKKSPIAFDFFRRAIPALEADGKKDLALDAKRRLGTNLLAAALQSAMDDYKSDLSKIGKANQNHLTYEEIKDRESSLGLSSIQLPKLVTPMTQFEGTWNVTFSNGVKKQYKFDDSGNIDCVIPHLGKAEKYKLREDGKNIITNVEGSVRIEKFSIKAGKLEVEHFESEVAYKASMCAAKGTSSK